MNLSVLVLKHHALHTMQAAGCSSRKHSTVFGSIEPFAGRFNANQSYVFVVKKSGKDPDCIRAAPDASQNVIREAFVSLLKSGFRLVANYLLEKFHKCGK